MILGPLELLSNWKRKESLFPKNTSSWVDWVEKPQSKNNTWLGSIFISHSRTSISVLCFESGEMCVCNKLIGVLLFLSTWKAFFINQIKSLLLKSRNQIKVVNQNRGSEIEKTKSSDGNRSEKLPGYITPMSTIVLAYVLLSRKKGNKSHFYPQPRKLSFCSDYKKVTEHPMISVRDLFCVTTQ